MERKMGDSELRDKIQHILSRGLKTESMPRADTDDDVRTIVARLQAVHGNLEQQLVIGGFTLNPVRHGGFDQPCETCMYYLVHRNWCDLPELDLPVEPEWSCRLWRI